MDLELSQGSRSQSLSQEQQRELEMQKELAKNQQMERQLPEVQKQVDAAIRPNAQASLSGYSAEDQKLLKDACGRAAFGCHTGRNAPNIDSITMTKDGKHMVVNADRWHSYKVDIKNILGTEPKAPLQAASLNGDAQNSLSRSPAPNQPRNLTEPTKTEREQSSSVQQAAARELAALQQSGVQRAESTQAQASRSPSTPEHEATSPSKQTLDPTQRLGGISQQIAEHSKDALKTYSPEQQHQLISALSKEVADVTPNNPTINRISTNDHGELVAHYNRGSEIGINPQDVLQPKPEQKTTEASLSQAEPLSPERQAALDHANQVASGLRVGISPNDPEWAQKMQEQGLIKPEPEKSAEASYTAKEGDAALKVARALDPEHPAQALGHLRQSGQIKYIEGDNGNLIPNTKVGQTYTYNSELYSEQERVQLETIANKGISQETKINQQIEQQRQAQSTEQQATNWFAKTVDQARVEAEQNPNWINQAVVNLSVPNAQNFYTPLQAEPIKATTNQRIMGLDQDQIDQSIAEGIKNGHSDVRIALTLTAKHVAYEAWNLGTLGFVKENDQLIIQRDSGNISDEQYWQAATVSGGTKIAAIATGGVAGLSTKLATPAGLAAVGMAMDAEVQLGNLGVHQITDGKVGQESYSFTQTAAMGLGGYGLGKLAAMPIMNKPLFGKIIQTEAASLNAASESALAERAVATEGTESAFELRLARGERKMPSQEDINQNIADFKKNIDMEAFNRIYEKAPAAKLEIDNLADSIAAKYNGVVAKAPLKSVERSLEKIALDYNGDPRMIKDLARNTIVVKNENLGNVTAELEKAGAKIKTIQADSTPLGYSGVNATLETKIGVTAEIQVNTPEMIYAKESEKIARAMLGEDSYNAVASKIGIEGGKGHKYYEQWRSIPDEANQEALKIAKESRDYYDSIRKVSNGN